MLFLQPILSRKMPRSKEGIKRTKVSIDELSRAVVEGNVSVPAAAKEFIVSRTTLQNHKRKKDPDIDFEYQNNSDLWRVFTREQETMLTNYLVTSNTMLYGLSSTETRKLAYNFAKVNQIKFPDSWEKDRQAGKTWYHGFMQRHKGITLRKPQATTSNWLQKHPGKPITSYDVAEIVGHAYPKAFTPVNIQAGFRVSGIWPVNEDIFNDDELSSSSLTDRPVETQTTQISLSQQTNSSIPSTSTQSPVFQSPEQLRPFPEAGMRIGVAKGRRKTGKSRVLTETPGKREIEEEHAQRVANRKKRTRNITKKIIPEGSSSFEEDNLEVGSSSSDDADWPPQDHTHEDDKENEPIIKCDF
ncbi:hypothetical protein JTB14_004133 [Gonioctena quinquepunctata]|nr:hypothetical protein JTB14_004133 [Gonioctena quinquepunctata]